MEHVTQRSLLTAGALSAVLAPAVDAMAAQAGTAQPAQAKTGQGAPNVIWILLDDVGFGASSVFGGLVETPNLEALAAQGLRYTNFHTTAISSPTRAALLTGRNHHSVGLGLFPETAVDLPGYNAQIPANKATVAEILKNNGYSTYAVGKWHLTPAWEASPTGPYTHWPTGKGFEQYYGFLFGETDQWHPQLVDGTRALDDDPKGRHLNELLTDRAIQYIDQQNKKPFFLYYAPGATHAPHQVAKEWSAHYKGRFDAGWDSYREQVFANQKKLGLIPQNTALPPRNPNVKAWASLSADEKRLYTRYFETYAGFLSYTDAEIGRLIAYLKQSGQFDNTIIAVVIGDNGASKEGSEFGSTVGLGAVLYPNGDIARQLKDIDKIGTEYASANYPLGWAQATNAPFKQWKQDANSEGGTRNPLILSWPKGIQDKGGTRTQYGHVIDLLPTTLELAHLQAPAQIDGVKQDSIEGTSLAYSVTDAKAPSRHTTQYYEINGTRAIYHDGWKAGTLHKPGTAFDKDVWELYNVAVDPTETNDLAAKNPDKLKELKALFDSEGKKYNVFPLKDNLYQQFALDRSAYKDQEVVELNPGVGHIAGVAAPRLYSKYYRLTVDLDIGANSEGVLVANGGRFGGSSIFLQGGKLYYAQTNGVESALISSDVPLKSGKSKLTVEFSPNLWSGADITLYQDGNRIGKGKVPVRYGIAYFPYDEGFDIGRDQQTPVSELYKSPYAYNGKLEHVTIDYKAPLGSRVVGSVNQKVINTLISLKK
ncbi:sulfatase-like hydrolase/transferase [Duganella sp. FT80W]|uniref:Sulfatase-like hydrolase/transferase n=1 Tax=Duganella guangzhouensis TaxID=2666084 RepID=A0A6I2L2Y2_9BURK|nr:arylsulfatase [Duganella guangzhouensis]MRW92451.1 sulfatase-like hydrolase/transferase [Duganella guangzhouensis]